MKRTDRTDFFGKLVALDGERLRKALWNLYWRGSVGMRERIKAELDSDTQARRPRPAKKSIDRDWVLLKVRVADTKEALRSQRGVIGRERCCLQRA